MLEGDCLLAHYIFVSLIVDPRGGKVVVLESFVKSTIEILLSLLDKCSIEPDPSVIACSYFLVSVQCSN